MLNPDEISSGMLIRYTHQEDREGTNIMNGNEDPEKYPPAADYQPVSLLGDEALGMLKADYPGLFIRRSDPFNMLTLGFNVSINLTYEHLLRLRDVAPLLKVAVEQLQIEGIHALGLQPRMNAYEASIRQLRNEVADLRDVIQSRNDTIAYLQAQINDLNREDDNE